MRNFFDQYSENTKLQPMVAEISWSNNMVIMERCKDNLEREFYIQMSKKFGWTKNVLIHQIEGKSYEKFLLNQTNFEKAVPEKYKHQAILAVKDEYNLLRKINSYLKIILSKDLSVLILMVPNAKLRSFSL
jgi:predicted nuclease of restriction endonuclease-like (RecB) superfamily